MKLVQVDHTKEAELLFALERKAFCREYDLPSRNVAEQVEYLQGAQVYVLYDEEQPVGFFAFKKDVDKVELLAIAVDPEKQRKGYGKVMMDKVIALTKPHDITLVTHPKNTSAIIYYLKSGFEIYGYKENYYGDGQPRLMLRRHTTQ